MQSLYPYCFLRFCCSVNVSLKLATTPIVLCTHYIAFLMMHRPLCSATIVSSGMNRAAFGIVSFWCCGDRAKSSPTGTRPPISESQIKGPSELRRPPSDCDAQVTRVVSHLNSPFKLHPLAYAFRPPRQRTQNMVLASVFHPISGPLWRSYPLILSLTPQVSEPSN